LKPTTIAWLASARVISVSVIAPTEQRITLTLTFSTLIFSIEPLKASAEPCKSALIIRFNSLVSPSPAFLNKSSRETLWLACSFSLDL
jgi:hypothetical protein